jgi:4'-phosphopantetheinyl transferase
VDGDPAFVSVSHSGDWVVVAVTDAGPIGVDVEAHRGIGDDLARTVLDDTEFREVKQAPPGRKEAAFFTYWVRKEAAVKATGDGLRTDLKKVRVSGYRQRPLVLEYPASPAMWLADLEAGADHSAAVAVIAPRIPAVTHHNGAELLSTPASPHALG